MNELYAAEIINEYIYDFEPAKSLLVNEDIYIGIENQGFWTLSDDQIIKCSPNTLRSVSDISPKVA